MPIPLTTTFTGPSSCLATSAAYEVQTNGSSFNLLGPRKPQTDCFPTRYSPELDFFYSPAVCPDRYTPACVSVDHIGTNSQTRHVCCPDVGSFACPSQTANFQDPWQSTMGCVSVFTTPVTMPVLQTVQAGQAAQTISGKHVILKPTGTFYAFSIQVAFQASDSFLPPSTSTPADDDRSNASPGGLDRGAAIGIGVGVGVAAILILTGALLLWRRRRRTREQVEKNGYGGYGGGGGSTYSPSDTWYGMPQAKIPETPQEAPGVPVETISSEPVELPPYNQIAARQVPRTPIAEAMGDSFPPGSTYTR